MCHTLISDSIFFNVIDCDVDEHSSILYFSNPSILKGWYVIATDSGKYYRMMLPNDNEYFKDVDFLLTRANGFNLDINDNPLCLLKSVIFTPKYAVSAKLAAMHWYHQLDTSIVDECLNNFFKTSRYLRPGDLISVQMSKYYTMAPLGNPKLPDTLFFKVTDIEAASYNDANNILIGYYIDTMHTTLHQEPSVQFFIPKVMVECHPGVRINHSQWQYSVIPDGLSHFFSELEELILPFLSLQTQNIVLLNPVFLLTGKSGAGKSILLEGLAAKYGLRYFREECVLIQNSNPAQTEKTLNDIFCKISTISPCIFQFRTIEALCEDELGNNDERTIDYFIKKIKSISCTYPVLIFCTTSAESKLCTNLQRIFIDKIRVPALNSENRFSILQWLSKKMRVRLDLPLIKEIAQTTSNYCLSDLIQLISKAIVIHHKNNGLNSINLDDIFYSLNKNDLHLALAELNDAYADSIGAPEIPNVTWDDVGGLTELKDEILFSLSPSRTLDSFRRSGILLYGPPGTGKTLLAKAVATECKYNFLSVKGPELLNMYVGQSEKNVREVFQRARESAPCIIFFDELDSLAPKRGQSGGSGSVMDRVVSQLLAEMDGIQKNSNIFILAATNRPDLIDSAMLRPGRLDKKLYVSSCKDPESLLKVIKALTRKFNLSQYVNFQELVNMLPKLREITGADLYGICSEAWVEAARRTIKLCHEQNISFDQSVIVEQVDLVSAIAHFNISGNCGDNDCQ